MDSVYHNRAQPSLQLIFQGCGGLYNYMLGVAKRIQMKYELPKNTIYTGVSGGNLPMILLATGMDVQDAWENFNLPLLKKVDQYKTGALFNWNAECRQAALDYFPDDIHTQINHKCHVSISEVNYQLFQPGNLFSNDLISHWNSKEDVVDCIKASGFVPLFDTRLSSDYRDSWYVDGAMSDGEPQVAPKYQIPTMVIHFNMFRTFPNRYMWCTSNVEWATYLYELGYQDAVEHDYVFQTYCLPKKKYAHLPGMNIVYPIIPYQKMEIVPYQIPKWN